MDRLEKLSASPALRRKPRPVHLTRQPDAGGLDQAPQCIEPRHDRLNPKPRPRRLTAARRSLWGLALTGALSLMVPAQADEPIAYLPTFARSGDRLRWCQPRLILDGWWPWINRYAAPAADSDATRLLIHLPFGKNADEPMDADGYLEMRDAGLINVTDTFVDAWNDFHQRYPEVEVIFYTGTFAYDPDFVALQNDEDAWRQRADEALAPFLAVEGASIAMDKVTGTGEQHIVYRYARELAERMQADGRTLYVEGMHLSQQPHWWDLPVIVTEDQHRQIMSQPEKFATREQLAELGTEVILLARHGRANATWFQTVQDYDYTPLARLFGNWRDRRNTPPPDAAD